MTLRQTHTYAALEVTAMVYEEIAKKLRDAGYDHAFDKDEGAIDMQGIGLVKDPAEPEYVSLAVTLGFDNARAVGHCRVRKDALPPTPEFCFSIGYMPTSDGKAGEITTTIDKGPYELLTISPVSDKSYAGYLDRVGVAADPAVLRRAMDLLREATGFIGTRPNDAFVIALHARHEELRTLVEPKYKPDVDGRHNCVCDHFQAPAAAMCERCPHRDRATKRDLECWQMVMELRDTEAASVDVFADNPDGGPNCAIECNGEWTGWEARRFDGKTLHEALTAAVEAMRNAPGGTST